MVTDANTVEQPWPQWFPPGQVEAIQEAARASPRSFEDETCNRTIMVADDDIFSQKIMMHLLRSIGYKNVIGASDGVDVLEKMHSIVPDIIFMDLEMPKCDGFQCTQHLRSAYGHSRPYIISLTAHQSNDVIQRCQQVGMNAMCFKPITKDNLLSALNNAPTSA